MSGRILIIDSVATNRILLRVKMLAAKYAVDAVASCSEADEIVTRRPPDLILINLADQADDCHTFCRKMRASPQTEAIAIVSVGVADSSRSRYAALDAGADDVLARPICDTLMLARIRSLMRRRNLGRELTMRDGTNRSFGFEESGLGVLCAPIIAVISNDRAAGQHLLADIGEGMSAAIRLYEPDKALLRNARTAIPDLFVIDARKLTEIATYQLIAELKSRTETRLSQQLIIVPHGSVEAAAMALDLGADDVVFDNALADEIQLRACLLIRQKKRFDMLREKVRSGLRDAVIDPLTGLYNRRYAETHLRRIAEQAHTTQHAYSVIMVDIDHFKSINDTYGHAAGDRVLKALSERLIQSFRPVDLVARVGGEEFLIAMPGTHLIGAQVAAERMRWLINSRAFPIGEGAPPLRVTVSAGVATGLDTVDDLSFAELFKDADDALFCAKTSGRNAISISGAAA